MGRSILDETWLRLGDLGLLPDQPCGALDFRLVRLCSRTTQPRSAGGIVGICDPNDSRYARKLAIRVPAIDWQVAGLALLLYVGSPQSKESDDRVEAKLDIILRRVDPENAERLITEMNATYSGHETAAKAKIETRM